MADKKQPFDDEFNTDEFDAFDDDEFNFDDDDETTFQLDESEEEDDDDEKTDYMFSEEDNDAEEEADSEQEVELEETGRKPTFDPAVFIQNFVERIKNEEPKQLVKYGIGAAVALLFLIGGLMKLFTPSKTPTAQPKTQTSTMLSQQVSGLPVSIQGSSAPSTSNPGLVTLNNASAADNQSLSSPQSFSNMTPPAPVSTQNTPISTPSQPMQALPTVVNPSAMQQATQQNSDLNKHINLLDAQVAQLSQQLAADAQMNASNQAQISGLIKSIDSMQSQMAKLNNAMLTIATAVNQSANHQSGFVSNGNLVSANPIQAAPDYYVQAVIPGRAWLKNSNGQILTVAPGDAVPGYGTVTTIDSQNGVVITSTGTKIVFGIDEG